MKHIRFLGRNGSPLVLLLVLILPSFCDAADTSAALTVRESGAYLYSQQDVESDKIAKLQKGEALIPLGEAVATGVWYMVKTQEGLFGWVRASDLSLRDQAKKVFKEPQLSTWSALTSNGSTFEGTWTVAPNSPSASASGTWTLRNSSGSITLHGAWSAEKFSTGWNGRWSATLEGQQGEYTGSWTADFARPRDARFADLFEAAARNVIRGIWTGGNESGSWSIRAAR